MSKFVKVFSMDKTVIVNLEHLVRIEQLESDKDYRCRLCFVDGSRIELSECLEDFCERCDILPRLK